jgi:hypothetical protein
MKVRGFLEVLTPLVEICERCEGDWGLGNGKKFHLVPSLQAGKEFREALPLVKPLEAEPSRMGSQPPGWEPVRKRTLS